MTPDGDMDHIVKLLEMEAADVGHHKRMLKAAIRRRDALIRKLRHAGWTLREIEPHAGISNAAISQMEGRLRD